MVPPEGLWSTWETAPDAHHEAPRPRPRRPARAALAGAAAVRPAPRGQRAPRGARRRRGRVPRPPRGRLADPRPRGLARAAGLREPRAARAARRTTLRDRVRVGRGRASRFLRRPTPAPGRRAFVADVQVFAATEPRARVAFWRLLGRAARGGLGDRVAAGSRARWTASSTSRSAPQAWRARGVSLRLEDFELRIEDGTLFSTPDDARPHAHSPSWAARASASRPRPPSEREQLRQFSRRAGARSRGRLGLRPPAPCRLPPRARGRAQLEPEPDPGARRARGGARLAGALRSAASSSTRRFRARRGG